MEELDRRSFAKQSEQLKTLDIAELLCPKLKQIVEQISLKFLNQDDLASDALQILKEAEGNTTLTFPHGQFKKVSCSKSIKDQKLEDAVLSKVENKQLWKNYRESIKLQRILQKKENDFFKFNFWLKFYA